MSNPIRNKEEAFALMRIAKPVSSAPAAPGVYLLDDARGRPLYIGQSVNLNRRLETTRHRRRASRIRIIQCENHAEVEAWLIQELQPALNVTGKREPQFQLMFAKREIKEVTAIRLRPSVKQALQKAALDDARTVNALLEKIAIDWLKAGGYLK
jgi:excinuclease UvrABC nuclease subunit